MQQRGTTTGSSTDSTTYASNTEPMAKKPKQDLLEFSAPPLAPVATRKVVEEDSGRKRLKRHRSEMAGRVWIPDIWGQENFLKEWVDCTAFDRSMVPDGVVSARQALVQECRRANSPRLRIGMNRC